MGSAWHGTGGPGMNKNQLPPLCERPGESEIRQAQKRRGFNKVPTRLDVLMSLYKPAQRMALAKIRHAHSCLSSSAVARPTHTLLRTAGAGSFQGQQRVCRENPGSAGNPFQARCTRFEPPCGRKRAGTTALTPTISDRFPPVPDRFPTVSRPPVLHLPAGPCLGISLASRVWTCSTAAREEEQG